MAAKTSEDQRTLIQWLYERGEESLGQAVHDLLGHRGFTDGLSKVVQRAAKTKGHLDKNVELMLHLLNLPSRADYQKLMLKVEHLQGSLVNLSMKLDRLLAADERRKPKRRRDS